MTAKILSITNASWLLMQRMFARTVFLALLTVLGFAMLDLMVQSGMEDKFGLVRQFPEFLVMMKAAAVLTFIEMCVFWVRFNTAPRLDVQNVAKDAIHSPTGAAIVYAVNTLQWLARVVIMLYLMGPI